MRGPRILVFGGSLRTGSFSGRLANLAAKELAVLDADVSLVSLGDFPMPIFDADLEAREGAPESARNLRAMMNAHDGIFIATPEYNASIPPLLKNAIDWCSRSQSGDEDPFPRKPFGLGSTSNRRFGGMHALIALRQVLELGLGALVVPDQISVGHAATAFDEAGHLRDDRAAAFLRRSLNRLITVAQAEL